MEHLTTLVSTRIFQPYKKGFVSASPQARGGGGGGEQLLLESLKEGDNNPLSANNRSGLSAWRFEPTNYLNDTQRVDNNEEEEGGGIGGTGAENARRMVNNSSESIVMPATPVVALDDDKALDLALAGVGGEGNNKNNNNNHHHHHLPRIRPAHTLKLPIQVVRFDEPVRIRHVVTDRLLRVTHPEGSEHNADEQLDWHACDLVDAPTPKEEESLTPEERNALEFRILPADPEAPNEVCRHSLSSFVFAISFFPLL